MTKLNVLVTRPSPLGEQLVNRLRELNIRAHHTPLIGFSPGKDLRILPQLLSALRTDDLLFALSPRALHYAIPQLRQYHFAWPPHLRYFAIGKSSAALLAAACQQPVASPQGAEISEQLLALPALQQINAKRALLLRGNGGRELLSDTLRARGAEVIRCECYLRYPLSYNASILAAGWHARGINTLLVTSKEMLQQIHTLVPEHLHHWLLHCRLVVVSERLAVAARQLGWEQINVAESADNEALIRALQ